MGRLVIEENACAVQFHRNATAGDERVVHGEGIGGFMENSQKERNPGLESGVPEGSMRCI